uniref:cDNA FLJ30634 fis, clone CTONG2002453 n=1 Tax=Homo sapiens TaxID=9606 RepID=Q96DQ4_HUMAN|nr:unnamed protein product [Homo sapiens]
MRVKGYKALPPFQLPTCSSSTPLRFGPPRTNEVHTLWMRKRGSWLASLLPVIQFEDILTLGKDEVLKPQLLSTRSHSSWGRQRGKSLSKVYPASLRFIDLHKRQCSGKGRGPQKGAWQDRGC